MCCIDFTKKIIPFAITFTIGIFVAGFFYSLTGSNSANENHFDTSEKQINHNRTHCGFKKQMREPQDIMDFVPPVPVATPPPPAPPIAPPAPPAPPIAPEAFEDTLFPPTPPKTIVLRKDLKKQIR